MPKRMRRLQEDTRRRPQCRHENSSQTAYVFFLIQGTFPYVGAVQAKATVAPEQATRDQGSRIQSGPPFSEAFCRLQTASSTARQRMKTAHMSGRLIFSSSSKCRHKLLHTHAAHRA